MKKFIKNYKQTILLLLGIIIGGVVGAIFGEKVSVLSPLGDLFINLMFVIIVPLVFLTIATSIAKMSNPKRLGKIMVVTVIVIIITSVIAVLFGVLGTYFTKLVNTEDGETIKTSLEQVSQEEETQEMTILDQFVKTITVNDFSGLFSRNNLIAIIIFSIIFGIAMNKVGERAKPVLNILESATAIVSKVLDIIMYYAPIGLGCYFAVLVGSLGSTIVSGYLKTFFIYLLVCLVFYFGVYTIYAWIAGGRKGVKSFWKNVIPPTVTALATCSSAASIPVNIENTKKMGVSDDVAQTVIPLGTNIHKDGSIIGSVFKIMFLVCLFGTNIYTGSGFIQIVLISLIATLLVSAVPIGGGTISELMILSMMGYPITALPILTIIATIIDPPATTLNVVGNSLTAMLTSRFVDHKKVFKEEKK